MRPQRNYDLDVLLGECYGAPERAEQSLRILCDRLGEYFRWILWRKVENPTEREELCQDALVRFVRAVRRSQQSTDERPRDCTAYARVIASNVFHDYLRAKRPALYRFKDRVLYVLDGRGPDKRFARWQVPPDWLGGLARWRGGRFQVTEPYLAFRNDRSHLCRTALNHEDPAALPLHALMGGLFLWIKTPLEVDELTGYLAALQGVEQPAEVSLEMLTEEQASDLGLPAADIDLEREVIDRIDHQEYRRRVWDEILELPPLQRAALMLSMERQDLLTLTASIGRATSAMGLPPNEVLEIWKSLPLSDKQIAPRLGTTAKQTANLRKCARERLCRRLSRSNNRDKLIA